MLARLALDEWIHRVDVNFMPIVAYGEPDESLSPKNGGRLNFGETKSFGVKLPGFVIATQSHGNAYVLNSNWCCHVKSFHRCLRSIIR
jgi:hypothetical protein